MTSILSHAQALGVDVLRLATRLVLLSIIFLPLERLFALHAQPLFRKQVAVDIGYYFINGLVPGLLLSGPVALFAVVANHAIPSFWHEALMDLPIWARASLALVVGEVGYYWGHRWTHEIPLLWRFHAVHHSAEQIDYLVSSRAHPIDVVFTRLCMLAPIYGLGLVGTVKASDGVIALLVLLSGFVWGFFVHANVRWRLGAFEWFLSTPGFHHWHHVYGGERDCNYASILPFIDRVFGTHYLPNKWPPRYGMPEPMEPTLVGQLVHPFYSPLEEAEKIESAAQR